MFPSVPAVVSARVCWPIFLVLAVIWSFSDDFSGELPSSYHLGPLATSISLILGMLAAESVFSTLHEDSSLDAFWSSLKNSWLLKELHTARNYRPAFEYGLFSGLALSAIEHYVMKGKSPWTLKHGKPDHEATEVAAKKNSSMNKKIST